MDPLKWRHWPTCSWQPLIWQKRTNWTKFPKFYAKRYGKMVLPNTSVLRTIELNGRPLVAQLSTTGQTSRTVRESDLGQYHIDRKSAAGELWQLSGFCPWPARRRPIPSVKPGLFWAISPSAFPGKFRQSRWQEWIFQYLQLFCFNQLI